MHLKQKSNFRINALVLLSIHMSLFIPSAKPTITYDDKFKEPLKVKAGAKVVIDTTISGAPPPTSGWTFKDKDLEADKNVHPEAQPAYGKVTIYAAERTNAGPYKLTAENSVGKTEATFTLVVKGRMSFTSIIIRGGSIRYNLQPPHQESNGFAKYHAGSFLIIRIRSRNLKLIFIFEIQVATQSCQILPNLQNLWVG